VIRLRLVSFLLIILFPIAIAAVGCAPAPARPEDEPEEREEEEILEITLYFACPQAVHAAEPGEYGYVTPVTREIPHTDEVLHAAVRQLIEGPGEDEKAWCDKCDRDEWKLCEECLQQRVSPVMPDAVEILGINIDNGLAIIDLSEDLFAAEDGVAGTLGGGIFVQSMVWTATEFPTIDEVQVLVEGEYFDDGHMIWDEPKKRYEFPTGEGRKEDEVKEWIDRSRDFLLAQAREIDDTLYLLVTYGERPSGGYSVEIVRTTDDHVDFDDKFVVIAEFTEPDENERVVDAVTRPYVLKEIDPVHLPVRFLAKGDRGFAPPCMIWAG